MHHGTDADGGKALDLHAILLENVGTQIAVAVLKAEPYRSEAVGPQSVDKLVLPLMAALGYGLVVLIDQDRLYTGRAKLDTEDGFTLFNSSLCVHFHRVYYGRRLHEGLVKHIVHLVEADFTLDALEGSVLVDMEHLDTGHLCVVNPVFGSYVVREA